MKLFISVTFRLAASTKARMAAAEMPWASGVLRGKEEEGCSEPRHAAETLRPPSTASKGRERFIRNRIENLPLVGVGCVERLSQVQSRPSMRSQRGVRWRSEVAGNFGAVRRQAPA